MRGAAVVERDGLRAARERRNPFLAANFLLPFSSVQQLRTP